MSTPSKPQTVAKSKADAIAPPVIVISDEEAKEIPDPFPFPATYSANVDVALHKGTEAVLCIDLMVDDIILKHCPALYEILPSICVNYLY